ncbi:MAG: hypothetical protein COS89_01675 [Deltaproteobacteria bacterium CG07_land_8_20_14_0_80_38_7]|nr:MAG: hypothetical protein COS89_01675 [Deltaproteobacteria bacterium CG07_land_8_20_14_0_80_38_7]
MFSGSKINFNSQRNYPTNIPILRRPEDNHQGEDHAPQIQGTSIIIKWLGLSRPFFSFFKV